MDFDKVDGDVSLDDEILAHLLGQSVTKVMDVVPIRLDLGTAKQKKIAKCFQHDSFS
jgi:hypothetical protein